MKPRGYLTTFIQLASATGLPFGVLWSWLLASNAQRSFSAVFWPGGLLAGVAFGVLFGGVMALKFRAITETVPVGPDPNAFLTRLTMRLAEIGYHPEQPVGNAYTFRPSFSAGKAAGRITVVVDQAEATILGPVVHVRTLLAHLGKGASPALSAYRA